MQMRPSTSYSRYSISNRRLNPLVIYGEQNLNGKMPRSNVQWLLIPLMSYGIRRYRPGSHFVYLQKYAMFLVVLLERNGDLAQLISFARRIRKSTGVFLEPPTIFTRIVQACIAVMIHCRQRSLYGTNMARRFRLCVVPRRYRKHRNLPHCYLPILPSRRCISCRRR